MGRTITKLFLLIVSAVTVQVGANPFFFGQQNLTNSTPAPSYLLSENYEGTGYENVGWNEVTGSIDEDYTGVVLEGSQSVRLSGGASPDLYYVITASGDVWAYTIVQFVSFGTTRASIFGFRNGTTGMATFRVSSSGQVSLFTNGADSSNSSTTLSLGTPYHVWVHYVRLGTCELFVSPTATKPGADGSGNVYLTKAGGIDATVNRVSFRATEGEFIADKTRADDVSIGSSPL